MIAFSYPAFFSRRHGPQGYVDYTSYRDWLRDEFTFRCAYCLQRECWLRGGSVFAIDHIKPAAHYPHLVTDYDNLLYACSTCNTWKGDNAIPDPTMFLFRGSVSVDANGVIHASTPQAKKIVRVLDLDGPDATEFRKRWLDLLRLAEKHDAVLYTQLMGFPEDLPDLTALRPVRNTRPEGVSGSYHAQRLRGTLPATY